MRTGFRVLLTPYLLFLAFMVLFNGMLLGHSALKSDYGLMLLHAALIAALLAGGYVICQRRLSLMRYLCRPADTG